MLCVTCLVLDSLFVLIYSLTALSASSHNAKMACYEAHGYTWHTVVAGTFTVSAFIAVAGAIVHAMVVCSTPNTANQLGGVSRFAHSLVCWTFMAAVLEAIAYRQEPPECATIGRDGAAHSTDPGSAQVDPNMEPQDRSDVVWQVACTMLWLVWVTGSVAAGVLARRCVPLLLEENASPCSGTPQTVGMPVSRLPSGMVAVTGAAAAADGQPDGMGAGVVVAQGMPVQGAGGGDCSKGAASCGKG